MFSFLRTPNMLDGIECFSNMSYLWSVRLWGKIAERGQPVWSVSQGWESCLDLFSQKDQPQEFLQPH